MDDIDQFFHNSHYNIMRVLLGISGLWPFHTRSRRYVIYLAMVMIFGSNFIFQIICYMTYAQYKWKLQTLGIIEIWHDPFVLIDAMPPYFLTIMAISKMLCMIYVLPQMKILLIRMQEYCLSQKSDVEINIHNSHALYGRKLCYTYTVLDGDNCEVRKFSFKLGFILSHSIVYLLTSLLTRVFYTEPETDGLSSKVSNSQIGLPHRVNYMVDIDTYYFPIFTHSAMCDFVNTFLIVVIDVLYMTVVEHCCGLFAALRYRLEIALVFENDKLTMKKDKCYSNIVYCIRRHIETTQFVAIVESVYSLSIFIQIGLLVLLLSFLGYQLMNDMGDINQILKSAAFLNAILFNVFFENWQGQKIIDSSERVFESAYNTEWYSMPIATRKLLIMMMMKSEKPSILRMGKFVVLSYVTFNTVLRTSSSYFMLLRSL